MKILLKKIKMLISKVLKSIIKSGNNRPLLPKKPLLESENSTDKSGVKESFILYYLL
jgi:hypothetical protein